MNEGAIEEAGLLKGTETCASSSSHLVLMDERAQDVAPSHALEVVELGRPMQRGVGR